MIFATLFQRCALVAALLIAAPIASAQTVGDCELGRAERDLDINDVLARVFNSGNLFFGNTTVNGDGYLVPRTGGNYPYAPSPIYNMQFWVGGLVGDALRVAGSTYDDFEFWPGPLDADRNPPEDCSEYDRIYVVSRGDVARYYETGRVTDDLRDWPVDLGAPVLDGDGVAGNYDLDGGDEPAISGEQVAWWVMNDVGNTHDNNETPPLGLEVRVEAFAKPSLEPAVDQATFYRYRIRYRGDEPLDSAFVSLFLDPDLGDAADDFVGTDTTLNMAFAYNGDESDAVYGIPPAVGFMGLRRPVGLPNGEDDDGDGTVDEADEQADLYGNNILCPDSRLGPFNAVGNYRCMRGLHRDGVPITEAGSGYKTDGPVTTVYFAGDPVTEQFWSEENPDGSGARNPVGDRQMWPSFGPFRLEPGEETEFVFAIPFAQGVDRLDSIVKLREAARYIRNAYDLGLFEPQRVRPVPPEPELPQTFALRAFPNPFASSASVELTVAAGAGALRLSVYDVLGREVGVLADGVLAAGAYSFSLDGDALPAGVYFVRLATGRQTESIPLIHTD